MLNPQSLQLRVGVDVGSRCHHVAVGLTDGSLFEDFEIPHTAEGFREFFARIEGHAKRHPYPSERQGARRGIDCLLFAMRRSVSNPDK